MTPGPNNLLSMNNARCYGSRSAFIADLGRIAAFAVMIAFNLWRSEASHVSELEDTRNRLGLAKQEFLLAACNPKANSIFTALPPSL